MKPLLGLFLKPFSSCILLNVIGGIFFVKNDLIEINIHTFYWTFIYGSCRNPRLGLATKARACKVAGQKGSLGVTLHALGV